MKHFQKIAEGLPVAEVMAQLYQHPELWNQHGPRKEFPDSPHANTSDIWVRFNDYAKLDPCDFGKMSAEHIPVWYPAWAALPALKPIIFGLMSLVQGEMLGGVLITKIPPGGKVEPHADASWHVEQYDKFYVTLQSKAGAIFGASDGSVTEELSTRDGDCYLFDNRMMHWVENKSDVDRITLIICIRTEKFGRTSET